MGDRMMQPVQSPTTPSSSATFSSEFIRTLPSSVGLLATAGGVAAVSAPSRPHSHPPALSSPESFVIRNLKKRMNRLDLNVQTPSSPSCNPLTAASADTGSRTGPYGGGTTAATATPAAAAAVAAALTAAITPPTSRPSAHSNYRDTKYDNSSSSKKSSRRHKKDRNWKYGQPATLAPLSHPSTSSLHHSFHRSHHHGQDGTGGGGEEGGGRTRHRESGIVSGHGNSLVAGGVEGGGNPEGSIGGRRATEKGIGGVYGGGEIVGGEGGTMAEATTAIGSDGGGELGNNGNGGNVISAGGGGGGGREGRRRKKNEKESGGTRRKRTTSVNSQHITITHNLGGNKNIGQAGWIPSGVGGKGSDGSLGDEEYQWGPARTETGTGMGATGGEVGYSCSSSMAGIQGPGSSPGLQYQHHQDYQPLSQHHHAYQQQQHQQNYYEQLHQYLHQQHQQYRKNQQVRPSANMYPEQHYAQQHQGQQQQQGGPGAPDKAIRSSFPQGIKTHTLQPTQLTHLTLLRYEFLLNEFVEMMRLLPALQVLDLDIVSVSICSCGTFSHPYARHHPQQQQQQSSHHHRQSHPRHNQSFHNGPQSQSPYQQPQDPCPGHHFRSSSYTETPYSWHSSQNDNSDDMDVDYEESNPPSAATLCSQCIRKEALFRCNEGTSTATAGPQDQFPTVRSLTFRGIVIVPDLIALLPNLETLAFEEIRYKTPPATTRPPSVPGDAFFHGSAYTRAHSRMCNSQSQGEFGSSSFYTDSSDDSLDATTSLSLEAGLTGPPSRQSVMISELALMLKNHCPLLTRLVLNEPLLVEDLSREQPRLQNTSLSSSSIGSRPPPGSSPRHIYPMNYQQLPSSVSRVQDQLALLLQVIPRLKQFVVHSWVLAKCPQLLDTLLEYHHPHLVSFQILDDSQDMLRHPSIQNPNATPNLSHEPQPHAFYSTQDIYDQRSPHQQQQLYEQQGHQYHSTFVSFGSESPALQQQQQQQQQYGHPEVQHQQTMLRLQASSFRIFESCPNLQIFESKIPLPLQQLIGSVPRWACGSEITVLWLEIQELTGNSGLDPEEEEVMQMFVRSLFKGSRSNLASSSPPKEVTSSESGEGGSSRLTSVSPSPPPTTGAKKATDIVSNESSSCAAVGDKASAPAAAGFGSHLLEVGSPGAESSILGVAAAATTGDGVTFPSPSLPSSHGVPSSTDAWTSQGTQPILSVLAVNVTPSPVTGVGAGIASGWNKPLLPPPPPLAFTSPATISSTTGGGASYASGTCHIEGIERLVALQFLVEHQLVYLPKLDRLLMGNRVYTIPTRDAL